LLYHRIALYYVWGRLDVRCKNAEESPDTIGQDTS